MWSGAITFGLVTVPVKLYPAVREEDIHFHLLHDQDHARLRRKMVCSADEQEVHPEHQIKGYEVAPDQYVIITEEELQSVQPEKSRAIEIMDFVDLHDIDPV
jgi:DNA end-binding protein Ku